METDVNPTQAPAASRLPAFAIGALVLALIAGGGYFALRYFQNVSQETAQAMPSDTLLYVSVDFLSALTNNFSGGERIEYALQPILDEFASSEGGEALGESFEQDVLADLDMTIQDDLASWIGRSVGMGILEITPPAEGSDTFPLPETLIAVEIRTGSDAQADAFLTKLITNYPTSPEGNPLNGAEYAGVTYYVEQTDGEGPLVVGRSNNLMLFATSEAAIQKGIETQQGSVSLAENTSYQGVSAELPEERIMTFYLSMEKFREGLEPTDQSTLFNEMFTLQTDPTALDDLSEVYELYRRALSVDQSALAAGGAIFFDDLGLRTTIVNLFDPEKINEDSGLTMSREIMPTGKAAETLPADTLFYFAARDMMTLYWDTYKEVDPEGFAEAMEQAQTMIGLNPDTDLMPRLNGEFAMGVYKSQEGFMATDPTFDVELGTMILQEIDAQPGDLTESVFEPLNTAASEMLFMPVESDVTDDYELYSFMNSFAEPPAPLLTYGVNNGYLMFGSSVDEMKTMFGADAKLPDNPNYGAVLAQSAESDSNVMMFVDFELICTVAGVDDEFCRYVERINAIAMTAAARETVSISDIYILLDEAPEATE